MFLSKIIENKKIIKKKVKSDIKQILVEKKKNLKIKIPKNNVSFNLNNCEDDTPKITHHEIEINTY